MGFWRRNAYISPVHFGQATDLLKSKPGLDADARGYTDTPQQREIRYRSFPFSHAHMLRCICWDASIIRLFFSKIRCGLTWKL